MVTKIRVFISYSHRDKSLAKKVAGALDENNIVPLWDEDLIPGTGFHEQIKDYISQSHIIMPLLTELSSERIWVHQEIGYAMALHIPVLPLTTQDIIPGGMLQIIHAMKIIDDEAVLRKLLNRSSLEALISNSNSVPLFECAHLPEERARMMAEYCSKVSSINKFGTVRQKGGLSSFHIPLASTLKQVWTDRYFPENRSDYHKLVQRNERLALQQHADQEGCRLIVNPAYALQGRSGVSGRTRLQTLIDFLYTQENVKTVVAIQMNLEKKESLTIVGDWFLAESVSFKEGDGFTNTFFTRDVSEIVRRIDDFDGELEDILENLGWKEEDSKDLAIKELNKILTKIED